MRSAKPIYVENLMRCPFDALWAHTQQPELHERWDLRFTDINYLPKERDDQPQQFTYETRIGFGLRIAGTGESVGSHDTEIASTSALKFGSDDHKSLIRTGSGYWKYIRTNDGIRFITLYDYETRGGFLGTFIDRFIFRPLVGWATAWSFDRLRLWLERGIDPALSIQRNIIHTICRIALALVWIWHGLVPKLIVRHPGELKPLEITGLFTGYELQFVLAAGACEIIFGLIHLIFWRVRWIYLIDLITFITLGIGAIITMPATALAPFNPVSFTLALAAIAIIGLMSSRDLPSAKRCLRVKPREAGGRE